MLEGGCLCGGVRYRISGRIGPIAHCHCKQCQRASGAAFATNASVRERYFAWLQGSELVTEYESSPGKIRAFCSRCGSPLYSRRLDVPDERRIRLGTLDGDPDRRPLLHVWVSAMPPWDAIHDDLPRYPDGDVPATPRDPDAR